jgi:spermidine/putrescine-binding protein
MKLRLKAAALLVILAACLILAGCEMGSWLPAWMQPPSPTSPTGEVVEGTATATATPKPSATPAPDRKLVIWLPPQFDPSLPDSTAGKILQEQLQAFVKEHPDMAVEVRIKATGGAGGMLESLAAAGAAAPDALPDLVALPRSDLETAALKGLVYPFNQGLALANDPDWYNFARQMSLVEGASYGLPFAGDALVLVYRPAQLPVVPASWSNLFNQGLVLAFPANDPQAVFTLALYQGAGGEVKDPQGRPTLNAEILNRTLQEFQAGVTTQTLPAWLTQLVDDEAAWDSYNDQRSACLVTWASQYLSRLPADSSVTALLPVGDTAYTLADGYVWASARPPELQHELLYDLSGSLTESNFISRWTAAAGYLPPRPTALAAWPNQNLQSLLSQVVLSARLRPPNDINIILGPVVRDAVLQILKGEKDALQASQAAAERVKGP